MLHVPLLKALVNDKLEVASQNVSNMKNGAFTGEVTAEQLKNFGVKWTLVGHSERRSLFGDSNEVVAEKCKLAQGNELNTILCIGEKLEEREEEKTMQVVDTQLDAVKDSITTWDSVVIAYEPVWAIGTGKVASPEQAQEVHQHIREWVKTNVSEEVAGKMRIIYGGSVNDKNCVNLIEQADIDGFLVGGASLKPAFRTIVEAANDKVKAIHTA